MTSLDKYFVLLGGAERSKAPSLAAVLAVLWATLWPFDLFPSNGVHWLKNADGLKFKRAGTRREESTPTQLTSRNPSEKIVQRIDSAMAVLDAVISFLIMRTWARSTRKLRLDLHRS